MRLQAHANRVVRMLVSGALELHRNKRFQTQELLQGQMEWQGSGCLASTTPRCGVWDLCENTGLQPNDWNPIMERVECG